MRIAQVLHIEPRVLVALLDQQDALLLPLWLPSPEGLPLYLLQKKRHEPSAAAAAAQASSPATPPTADLPAQHQAPQDRGVPLGTRGSDFVASLLSAFGATVEHVQIGELTDRFYATVLVHSPAGEHSVQARLSEGLFAALRYERPLLVTERLAAREGVAVPTGSEPLSQRVEQVLQMLSAQAPGLSPAEPRGNQPSNLNFTQGLRFWELRGSFLFDQTGRHWTDYTCDIEASELRAGGTGGDTGEQEQSAFLAATVPTPQGFADLRQAILADEYRGKRVRLAMVVKTEGVEQHAGPYVRMVDPGRTRPPEVRLEHRLQDTTDWTPIELSVDVPADAVFLLFGIHLTGPGKIWMAQVDVKAVGWPPAAT
jgi:hypothetical protein